MTKIDIVFVLIGIYCYFSITYQLRVQNAKAAEFDELQKKKELYANKLIEQKRRESLAKAAAERKQRNKIDMKAMASTVEMLSNFSDQEVMRQSKVTSGKY